jgi:membrane dipeptidase
LYKKSVDNIPLDSTENECLLCDDINGSKLQCYAIWLPDDLNGDEAEALFFKAACDLKKECERLNIILPKRGDNLRHAFLNNQNTAFFTVENSTALNGKLENVNKFAALGVRMMTLTWNAENLVGGGVESENRVGLTAFGKQVVREMENCGIIVDISHASQKLFYDVAENSTLPFAASHSNAYSVTSHKRNLTDEQFKIIMESGGIVGINFHNAFLNNNPDNACVTDILRHAEHFLSLGGENTICFGSDFDGGVLPSDIKNSSVYCEVYELMLKSGYSESLVKKIFYLNALNFNENFDNQRIM